MAYPDVWRNRRAYAIYGESVKWRGSETRAGFYTPNQSHMHPPVRMVDCMKVTHAILYAAMAGALVALPMQAAEETSRADRIETLKEELNLTPEQTEKIKTILQHQRQQAEKVREDSALSREQKMEKVREVAKTTVDEIRPILTQEQQTKLAAVGEKFREAFQSHVSERRGATEGAVKTE